jgi:hypothetical protein
MDCKTARLLLDFHRPQAAELDAAAAAELERHLTVCLECGELARRERRLDDCLGRAMRQVEVPTGLRGLLLSRLESERTERERRRWGQGLRILAAAAAVLLLVWGGVKWRQAHLPKITFTETQEWVNGRLMRPPGPEEVEDYFRRHGSTAFVPADLNYAFLLCYGLGDFQGHQVPQLLFLRDDRDRQVHEHAQVYILSTKQFDLKGLEQTVAAGYGDCKVEVTLHDTGRYAYVIVYTGDSLAWLRRAGS